MNIEPAANSERRDGVLSGDRTALRELAKRYLDVCAREEQQERRRLWRAQNSLKAVRPLIYVRAFAWDEMAESRCVCEEPFLREFEDFFRRSLFWDSLADDSIFEPWVTVSAVHVIPKEGLWGLPIRWIANEDGRGSKRMDPALVNPEDAARMVEPHHVIDEVETERRVERISDAIGDIITINVDRAPVYRMWNGDISTRLAQLRGLDQLMLDMMERPEWLHGVLAFMRDGILRTHEEAEQAGDWRL
ncbi:MAG: hypothetical protein HZB26_13720 [Candidatus Hydrogenedentes bacterium]|nr:hypothetical protein [Candidatus Hydrogenedentota bacterium]